MTQSWTDDVTIGVIVGILVAVVADFLRREAIKRRLRPVDKYRRVLFPFVGSAISYGALDAAIRLANAEQATLVPVYLARVPMRLSLDAAITRQGATAVDLLEAVEQRALRAGVPVDSRIVRGRTGQHAMQKLTEDENYYRMVLPAASGTEDGLDAPAIAWALDHAPGEIIVLRPGSDAPARRRIPRWDNRAPVSGAHQERLRRGSPTPTLRPEWTRRQQQRQA
ncbi:MAG: universal stress protein [Thermoleophilaceae bacterium]|nr:universal stress protein [Thermoleophilaceae bacterium]